MRLNPILMVWLLASAMLASGCSTMLVHTNRPDAELYMDGQLIGVGQAKVKSMGLPKTSVIHAKHEGEVVSRTVVREFTIVTALLMPFSYFTSAIWGWQYPGSTFMRFEKAKSTEDLWRPSNDDAWSKPIHEYGTEALTQSAADSSPWGVPPKNTENRATDTQDGEAVP